MVRKKDRSGSPEERKTSIPYQTLAEIYNQVMRHVDYKEWARYISSIIQQNMGQEVRILDIGCGTGELIHKLKKTGYSADGCDPSVSMLNMARTRNPDLNFWIDRLPELTNTPAGRYNVMISLYDTVNYLDSLEKIEQALDRIYQLLPPNSLFIFDLVSRKFCELYFDNVRDEEVLNRDFAYERHSYFIKATSEQINEFVIYTPDGIFEEVHVQKIFRFQDIESLIREKTTFETIGIFEDFTFFRAEQNSNRAHFVLRKPAHD